MNESMNIKQQFNKHNKLNLTAAVCLTIIQSFLSIALAFILKALMEIAGGGTLSELVRLLVICIVYLLIYLLITQLANSFTNRYIQKALIQFKETCFERYLKKSITAFQQADEGTYISSLTNDINSIETNYLSARISFFTHLSLLISGIAAMLYLNWKLALCVLFACFLPFLISIIFGNQLAEKEKNVSEGNSAFTSLVKNLFGGFSIIKSFQSEKEIQTLFNQRNQSLETDKKQRRGLNYFIQVLSMLVSSIINFLVFGYGAYLSIQGEISAAAVIAFIQLLNYVIAPLQQLPILYSGYQAGAALIERLQTLMACEQDTKHDELTAFNEAIRVENLTFGYTDQPILKGINFTFKKNKRYAIVGSSGSGKSTLLNLLMGYIDAASGNIYYDDQPLNRISSASLSACLSLIQQNVFIFDDTLHANISMYKDFDKDELEKVIAISGLTEVSKEKGMAYRCGENGKNLSGGERQRVAIARALLRNTPILFVDEATSALDNAIAQKVEEAILSIQNQTCICVTHRLQAETLAQFDEILVMHHGMLCESGTFNELLDRKQVFYSLYKLSAA
ncbi:ABC transporter ATP-binding protein [Dielma fastidiosa]|uniref:ABC transporter ATP-binding protein n=1 Tax=Dielma fastidiosa TaxID=1034346 RepID=UPI0035640F6E